MQNKSDIKQWVTKEALIVGSQLALCMGSAEIGMPLVYQYKQETANGPLPFSMKEIAATIAVGYSIVTAGLRLPILRKMRFCDGCLQDEGSVDDDGRRYLFSSLANFMMGPVSLAIGSAILGTKISSGDAFSFGYLSPITGLGASLIAVTPIILCTARQMVCCYENPRIEDQREQPNLELEPIEIKVQHEGELSLSEDNGLRPVIFSAMKKQKGLENQNKDIIPPEYEPGEASRYQP